MATDSPNTAPALPHGEPQDSLQPGQLVDDLRIQLRKAQDASENYQKQLAAIQEQLDDALESQAKLQGAADAHAERLGVLQRFEEALDMDEEAEAQGGISEEDKDGTIQDLRRHLARGDLRRLDLEATSNHRINELEEKLLSLGKTQDANFVNSSTSTAVESSINVLEQERQKSESLETEVLRLKEENSTLLQQVSSLNEIQNANTVTISTTSAVVERSKENLQQEREKSQKLEDEVLMLKEENGALLQQLSSLSEAQNTNAETKPSTAGTESSTDVLDQEREKSQTLEAEVQKLKEENSALSQYINRIVVRLMDHDGFEELLSNGSATGDNPLNAEKHDMPEDALTSQNRAVISPAPVNENPDTAISIPLRRRVPVRTTTADGGGRTSSSASRQSSTHRSPTATQRRGSYFSISGPTTSDGPNNAAEIPAAHISLSRTPSDSGYSESVVSLSGTTGGNAQRNISGSTSDTRTPAGNATTTPPRGTGGGLTGPGTLFTAAGPGTANKIRPLRLVQEKVEADEADRKDRTILNRASRWFGSGSTPATAGANATGTSTAIQGTVPTRSSIPRSPTPTPASRIRSNEMMAPPPPQPSFAVPAQMIRSTSQGDS